MNKKQFCIRNRAAESRFSSFTKKADIYGDTVSFQTKGESSHKTVCGSIITTFVFTVLVGYTVIRALVYANRDDTTHLEYTKFDGLPNEQVLTYEEIGFNIFVMFFPKVWTSFDFSKYPDVTEYVSVKAYQYNIAATMQGTVEATKTEIKTRRCTLDDLSDFYELEPIQVAKLTVSTCLDNPRDYHLKGAAGRWAIESIVWEVSRCTENCRSEEEIDEFLANWDVTFEYNN